MPTEFAIVGGGWRAEFYLRVARELSDRFHVCVIVEPNVERAEYLKGKWGVVVVDGIDKISRIHAPKFVVLCLPQAILSDAIMQAVDMKYPMLTETHLTKERGIETIAQLYEKAGKTGLVQVAEQYWLQPIHAARLHIIQAGIIGNAFEAQVSVGHGYHGISLMRKYLNVAYESCRIWGKRFVNRIIKGRDRYGNYPNEEILVDNPQDFVVFDFGDKWGVFDFTEEQYFSAIRGPRVLIRGERGEVLNRDIRYLVDHRTPIEFSLNRVASGVDGSLWGPYTVGITGGGKWHFKNAFAPARLSDDELAIATMLENMHQFSEGGKSAYSLAEGCQDQYLNWMMRKAVAAGEQIATEKQIWTH